MGTESIVEQPMQESTCTTCGRPSPAWGEHAAVRRRPRRAADGRHARAVGAATRRPRARVGLRSRGTRAGGGAARRSRRPGGAVRRRGGDDVDRGGAAESLGLDNVRTRVLDLDRIDPADASYDVVLCREGLMFALDPGGHGPRDRTRAPTGRSGRVRGLGATRTQPVAGNRAGRGERPAREPVPPPGIPGPFSLDDSRQARRACSSDAGLAEVEVLELPTPYRAGSVEEWWTRTAALAGPLAQRLAGLPEPAATALLSRARAAISAYETPTGLEIPGLSLIASATRV